MAEAPRTYGRAEVVASAAYGSLVGFLAGLVGLGGAEERIPFILFYLRLPLEEMIVVNLLVSLATVLFNLAVRISAGVWSGDAALVSLVMAIGSLPGAYLGASLSHRVSRRALRRFIALILIVVIARVAYGLLLGGSPGQGLVPSLELTLSTLAGFGVGIVSGMVGVAGGEYRIPLLTYVLGLPIKIAGTASQIVSVPTILVAAWKYRRLGSITKRSLQTAALLGIPSVAGAIASGFLVATVASSYIEILFVAILGYTVVRLVRSLE